MKDHRGILELPVTPGAISNSFKLWPHFCTFTALAYSSLLDADKVGTIWTSPYSVLKKTDIWSKSERKELNYEGKSIMNQVALPPLTVP